MKILNQITTVIAIILTTIFFIAIYKYFSPIHKLPEEKTTVKPLSEYEYTIGWSVYNSSLEFFQIMQQGLLDRAAELHMRVLTHDQNGQTSEMISGVQDLIDQGIHALVISPVNTNAMPIIASMTKAAGIPLIIVDIGTGGVDYDAFIISDSFGGGVLAGEYGVRLLESRNLPSKNFAILKAEESAQFANMRGEAFERVFTDYGYINVAEITANSDDTQAYEAMKSILLDYKDDLAIVFAENDRMALGAARAIDEASKKGEILVIGYDGDPAAIAAIKNGDMQGTIAQKPYEMGKLGAESANKILGGGEIIYDDRETKTLLVEIYLIDEFGNTKSTSP